MIQNNKILTVSYGTFSCTLEGFDDSFDTMKAIAEYFRDLASDDRFFGAEPPVPDAEMLARIAQREISRKVEARRLDGGGFALRANEAGDPDPDQPTVPKAAEQADGTIVADSVPEADLFQEAEATPAPAMKAESPASLAEAPMAQDDPDPAHSAQNAEAETPGQARKEVTAMEDPGYHPFLLAVFQSNEDEEAEAVFDEPTRGPSLAEAMAREDGDIPEAELYDPPATEVDSIAAKLARIRAVVSRSETPLRTKATVATEHSEDCHDVVAEDVTLIPMNEVRATETALSKPEEIQPTETVETIAEDIQPTETQQAPEDDVQTTGAASNTQAENVQPTGTVEPEPEDDPEESMQDILNRLDMALANTSEDGEYGFVPDIPDNMNGESQETDGGPFSVARTAEVEEAEAQNEKEPSRSGSQCDSAENRAEKTDAPLTAEPEESPEDMQAPVLFESPEPEAQEPVSELADDDSFKAASSTELDAKAEDTHMREDNGDDIAPCEKSSLRPHLLKLKRCDFESALTAGDVEDVEPEQKKAAHSDLMPEPDVHVLEMTDAVEPESEADRPGLTDDKSDFDGESNTAHFPDTGDRTPLTEADATEDPDLERLLAVADSRLDDPESASKHQTYKHLRGAAAATEAENAEFVPPKAAKSPEDAYRDDLASVVRPRRPTASGKGSDRSPSDSRPAPLQLAAEQRVDIDHAAAHRGPVRPRRIATEIQKVAEDDSENDGNFHEFAAEMGATELPELLEAAAAYLVYVEGRAQFSRPQVMNKVRQIKKTTYNREDGLRSFGRLVRDGKIEKTGGGRFTAAGDIGFRPDEHVSG